MKAILVLDMPKACMDCDLCFECRDCMRRPEDIPYDIEKFAETFSDDRMPWCPLRPLPERKDVRFASAIIYEAQKQDKDPKFYNGWLHGWNACLDAITGGKV